MRLWTATPPAQGTHTAPATSAGKNRRVYCPWDTRITRVPWANIPLHMPEIRITYGKFLDPLCRAVFQIKNPGKLYPPETKTQRIIPLYKQKWAVLSDTILGSLEKILHLQFPHPLVDVYIVGRGPTFSDPLIISSHWAPETFVDVLTHELIHRLLASHTQRADSGAIIATLFPNEPNLLRTHIVVHAVHAKIYHDILHAPQRMARNIERDQSKPAYRRAWEIVESVGYSSILDQFHAYLYA